MTEQAKKITVINDKVVVNVGTVEEPYVSYEIKSAHHAVAASLHIMLKHMADMHSLMFQVISEKYNIPMNDIIDVLHEDERVQKMIVEPTVHSLNYFTQDDIDKTLENKMKNLEIAEEPPKKKKFIKKIIKKET